MDKEAEIAQLQLKEAEEQTLASAAKVVNIDDSKMVEPASESGSPPNPDLQREIELFIRSKDDQTSLAHPGWRVTYIIASWIVLGYGVTAGNGFFVGCFLFSCALAMDYLRFRPRERVRTVFRKIAISWSALWWLISLSGLVGVLTIRQQGTGLYVSVQNFAVLNHVAFPFKWMYLGLAMTIILTVIDWVVEKREIEIILSDAE